MTPGNDGASRPEDDDPFGYLYADGQAAGATPPTGGGYGYPGPRSYNRVRTVGERQYGGQQQQQYGQQQYGQQGAAQGQPQDQGQAYGRPAPQQYHNPNPHYSAPETLPGGGAPAREHGYDDRGSRGRGPNTRGLLIGAVAVVAAVVIGIGVAVLSGGSDDDKASDKPTDQPTAGQSVEPSEQPTKKPDKPVDLPKTDAKALTLTGGTVTATDIPGAQADGGVYVAGLNTPGAQVTWTVNDIPKAGDYTLFVTYGVPGHAANPAFSVNGKPFSGGLNMDNFAGAEEGDWEKGWTKTYAYVQLNKGTNTFTIACPPDGKCDANLDQLWLKEGKVKR